MISGISEYLLAVLTVHFRVVVKVQGSPLFGRPHSIIVFLVPLHKFQIVAKAFHL